MLDLVPRLRGAGFQTCQNGNDSLIGYGYRVGKTETSIRASPMKRIAWSTLLTLVLASEAAAESRTLTLTVTAGPLDRVNVPVCIPVNVPDGLAKEEAAVIRMADGKSIPAQLTGPGLLNDSPKAPAGQVAREVHFILPDLKANESITLKALIKATPSAKDESFHWQDNPGKYTELSFGSRPVMRYVYEALDESNGEAPPGDLQGLPPPL